MTIWKEATGFPGRSSTPLFAGDKKVLLPVIEYACTILLESPVPFSPSLLEEKALNHFL